MREEAFDGYRSISPEDFSSEKKIFNQVPILDIPKKRLFEIIKNAKPGGAEYMVTPNVDHLRLLDGGNDEFLKAYKCSSLIVCDSRVLRMLSRVFPGDTLNYVNTGSDTTRELFGFEWFINSKVAIIGSSFSDVDKIRSVYGFSDITVHVPPMGFISNKEHVAACLKFVEASDPDYILIAVGCPQGELLAHNIFCAFNNKLTRLKLSMCIGASIDFIVGKQKRAPYLLQILGLEWFYRLLCNFSRLKSRYYLDFLWLLIFAKKTILGGRREV